MVGPIRAIITFIVGSLMPPIVSEPLSSRKRFPLVFAFPASMLYSLSFFLADSYSRKEMNDLLDPLPS